MMSFLYSYFNEIYFLVRAHSFSLYLRCAQHFPQYHLLLPVIVDLISVCPIIVDYDALGLTVIVLALSLYPLALLL